MNSVQRPLILVVEDTPRDRELLVTLLEREGYQVAPAADGAQALDAAARNKPDLILLDVVLPGMDGLEICRRLKADPGTHAIPVIFLTGQAESAEILAGFEAGAVDYVTKPFRFRELLARVHVHVELRRVQNEVKTLQGILPTCAKCRKVRDEHGAWHAMETYIATRTDALFSHGYCPECIPLLFPDLDQDAK